MRCDSHPTWGPALPSGRWLAAILALLAGCAPQRRVEVQIDSSSCGCKPLRLELFLLRAGEGCARDWASGEGSGERSLSAEGGDLVALVLGYAGPAGRADASSRGSFCASDFTFPVPDVLLMGDKLIPKTDKLLPKEGYPYPKDYVVSYGDKSFCGDKLCSTKDGESCKTCPVDCGACPKTDFATGFPDKSLPTCGDKVCNGGETCKSCPSDCACPATDLASGKDGAVFPDGRSPGTDMRVECVCCFGVGRVPAEQGLTLHLSPASCSVPPSALTAAGLPVTTMPPPRCP